MVVKKGFVVTALAVALVMTLSGCSNMSKHERNTAIGARSGAVGGAILTGGGIIGRLMARTPCCQILY